jgi:hypothetical protein
MSNETVGADIGQLAEALKDESKALPSGLKLAMLGAGVVLMAVSMGKKMFGESELSASQQLMHRRVNSGELHE